MRDDSLVMPRDSTTETGTYPRHRRDQFILLVFCLLATLPVWLPIYPRMCDMPGHAGEIALLRNIHSAQFPYSHEYRINWFTPYLLGYLLTCGLTFFVKIVTACKIVIALLLAAIPLVTSLLLRRANIEAFWAILTIPGLYGFAYDWGFLNFLVAVPIGLLFLYCVLRDFDRTGGDVSIPIVFFAIALFFCHALVCAFCIVIVSCKALAEVRPIRKAVFFILSLTPVIPIAALWALLTRDKLGPNRSIFWDIHPFLTHDGWYSSFAARSRLHMLLNGWGRISGFFPRLLGARSGLMCAILGLSILAVPVLAVGVQKRFAAWIPICICLGVLSFAPDTMFGTNFVYQRFSVFVLPLFLLVLGRGRLSRDGQVMAKSRAALLVIYCIASASRRALAFDSSVRGFKERIVHMEPGQRALQMVFIPDDRVSTAPDVLEVPSWYSAEHMGVVEPGAPMNFPQLVVYRQDSMPDPILWDFEWHPQEFQWTKYDGDRYRYFIVRAATPADQYFSSAPCKIALRYHSGDWWLYEKPNDCATTSSR